MKLRLILETLDVSRGAQSLLSHPLAGNLTERRSHSLSLRWWWTGLPVLPVLRTRDRIQLCLGIFPTNKRHHFGALIDQLVNDRSPYTLRSASNKNLAVCHVQFAASPAVPPMVRAKRSWSANMKFDERVRKISGLTNILLVLQYPLAILFCSRFLQLRTLARSRTLICYTARYVRASRFAPKVSCMGCCMRGLMIRVIPTRRICCAPGKHLPCNSGRNERISGS